MPGQTRASTPASTGDRTLRAAGGAPVAARRLLRLAQGLTAALVRRHRRAGTHGGLCPEAVRVEADGQVTLLDGYRPATDRAPYAAPEQSGRLSRDVDERADLYALGVILYELATGELPFGTARPAELVRAQLSGTAPAAAGTVPPGVAGLVATLLATLPEDRYQSAYAALARLLTDLAEHLVMRCGGQLDAWRERLTAELGGAAGVLVSISPALAPLCGTGTAAVSGRRARALLRLGVRRLLSAVCTAEAPVVLVLDDLHRADPASVELLRYVLSDPETTGLLMVAALRPKEVPEPVAALLREQATGRSTGTLSLRPLPDTALTELLADTLRARQQQAADLARVVADKTGSRPLAVAEFLRGLRDKRLLNFDEQVGVWEWDRMDLTEVKPVPDVLPAIQHRLAALPARPPR